MIVLIPVAQFSVRFEAVGGRPYSRFEQIVLQSVRNGTGTLSELEVQLQVHSRLIIEALVTLTQAGWLAVGERGFSLTAEGDRALLAGEPPETRISEERTGRILMERITGGLISNLRASFVNNAELHDSGQLESSLRIAPRVHEWELDEGQVQHCLTRRRNEWITRIGPIKLTAKDGCWIPVNVNPDLALISLLPSEWHARLQNLILDEAKRHVNRIPPESISDEWTWKARRRDHRRRRIESEGVREVVEPWGIQWRDNIHEADFLTSSADHRSLLRDALARAKSNVFIVSSFIRSSVIEDLADSIVAAVLRGVYIDVLWGYSGDSQESGAFAIEALRKIAFGTASGRGRLRFNRDPSGSHAKLLLWDTATGYECCVGSYNWFSARVGDGASLGKSDSDNVSVRFKHPGVVSSVARTIASLWTRVRSERLGSTQARLGTIISELERLNSRSEVVAIDGANQIGLVRDTEHEGVFQALIGNARKRLFIASHQLGEVGVLRLGQLFQRKAGEGIDLCVVYGASDLSKDIVRNFTEKLEEHGGALLCYPGLHCKVCISDDVAYVGSYNPLSGDPFGTASGSRELGAIIVGLADGNPLEQWSLKVRGH